MPLAVVGRRPLCPATTPDARHANKGRQYPADPPAVEEIIAVMRSAGESPEGLRVRALIVILWRAGLRITEAPALAESDLDRTTGAVLVRRGKGGKRREVGMDRWGWQQLDPWLDHRPSLPVGAMLCVMHVPTAGRPWSPSAARTTLRDLAVMAGVRRRFAPHQLRHAHAVELAREGVPLTVVQRQLGQANLGITSVYLQGIDNGEIVNTVFARPAATLPASAGLRRASPLGREHRQARRACRWYLEAQAGHAWLGSIAALSVSGRHRDTGPVKPGTWRPRGHRAKRAVPL
jgi:integrase